MHSRGRVATAGGTERKAFEGSAERLRWTQTRLKFKTERNGSSKERKHGGDATELWQCLNCALPGIRAPELSPTTLNETLCLQLLSHPHASVPSGLPP